MILDALLQFSSAQGSITTGAVDSTNVIDIGTMTTSAGVTTGLPTSANGGGARDLGIGDDPALKIYCVVATTFTSGGAATLAVSIQGAPDNGSGAPGSFTSWYSSPAYALATLVQGAQLLPIDMPRPPAGIAIPRYLKLVYTVAVTTFTGGAISAWLVIDRVDQITSTAGNLSGYPAGITVSN